VDPQSTDHIDFTILRIRISVPTLESIPSCRNMFFPDLQGRIKIFQLSFDTDISTNSISPPYLWSSDPFVLSWKPKQPSSSPSPKSTLPPQSLQLTPTSPHTSKAKSVSPEPAFPNNPFFILSSEPNLDRWDVWDHAIANVKSPHKKSKIDEVPSVPTEETRAIVAVVEPAIAQSAKDARQGQKVVALSDRKYTWAKSISSYFFVLLDRFLCTHSWGKHLLS
jgi:hypothetical protein